MDKCFYLGKITPNIGFLLWFLKIWELSHFNFSYENFTFSWKNMGISTGVASYGFICMFTWLVFSDESYSLSTTSILSMSLWLVFLMDSAILFFGVLQFCSLVLNRSRPSRSLAHRHLSRLARSLKPPRPVTEQKPASRPMTSSLYFTAPIRSRLSLAALRMKFEVRFLFPFNSCEFWCFFLYSEKYYSWKIWDL